jgi:hypothetical protein
MIPKPKNIYAETEAVVPLTSNPNDSLANVAKLANYCDVIPESVYQGLPCLLKDACNLFNDKYERDVFLLGTLTVLGGCFHNLAAFDDADKKQVATNLLSFIVAPSGNGKGVLKYSRKVAKQISQTFAANTKKLGSKEGGKLIIAANISSAGLIELLNQNKGAGIIIESEIDTLINANKQDWGNYSDILRNSFENESCSLYRKGDKIHSEIEKIKLSLAISGTPNQFKSLMFSAENGLFSRGCYYVFENNDPKLQFIGRINSSTDLEKQFELIAKRANDFYNLHLSFDELKIVFSREQLLKIENALQLEYNKILTVSDLRANIIRSYIVAQKIASILTFLEVCEKGTLSDNIPCTDIALNTAIELTLTSLKHSYKAYEHLPQKNFSVLSLSQQRLFQSLPDEFTRIETVEIGKSIGLKERTIDNCIQAYKKKGMIEEIGHGKFKKAS